MIARSYFSMLDKKRFKALVIGVIDYMDMYSQSATILQLGTFAHESLNGKYKRQISGGPGRGYGQMEPDTEKDIWRYLTRRTDIREKVIELTGITGPNVYALEHHLVYQICMVRVKYYMRPEPLPEPTNLIGMAEYWKLHYNTPDGAGTVEEFIDNYGRYVL
jgi:hypothetical protein